MFGVAVSPARVFVANSSSSKSRAELPMVPITSANVRRSRTIPERKDTCRPQTFKYLLQPLFLRGADEDDLTLLRLAHRIGVFDDESPAFNYLAIKRG